MGGTQWGWWGQGLALHPGLRSPNSLSCVCCWVSLAWTLRPLSENHSNSRSNNASLCR